MAAIAIVVSIGFFFAVWFQVHLTLYLQVIVGSINDWQKERQFKALNERKDERSVKLIRDGVEKMIDIKVFSLIFIIDMPSIQSVLCY
jgi:hypothetical protein